MIPFGSQRAHGQDLATHLQNAQDSEYVEVAELRGAIADDLHGAFAEWEVQAQALTRSTNYLYSLSINPDPAQGPLTREQYGDYIDRAERKLGLQDQPRAVVFHIKEGREHCHVVWSRTDATQHRAVQISFDRDKLMMVSREFARDHGLSLPEGYHKDRRRDDRDKSRQASLYEQHQQTVIGLTKEQRMDAVTEAWRHSDSPKAFVAALSDLGYVLANGRRPYRLVDIYGHVNSLPKLVKDKQVRIKNIRAFLERDYPPESLPSVDEARAMAAEHRKEIKAFHAGEDRAEQVARLEKRQAERRRKVEAEREALQARHRQERAALADTHLQQRQALNSAYLAQSRLVRRHRRDTRPTGLAAFLGKVSGVELVRKKVHAYQDRKRLDALQNSKRELADRQTRQQAELLRAQQMQSLDMQRKVRNLDKLDTRERRSLETSLNKERNERMRGRADHMPAFRLELRPPGRPAMLVRAANRFRNRTPEDRQRFNAKPADRKIELSDEFSHAARGGTSEGGGGSSDGQKPHTERPNRGRNQRGSRGRNSDQDRSR